MPSDLVLVYWTLASVLVQVLHAEVGCTPQQGGTCEPMSISKALLGNTTGSAPDARIAHPSRQFIKFTDCVTDSEPRVRNLSVSVFPDNKQGHRKFNLLIHWMTEGEFEGGYEIQVQTKGHSLFYTEVEDSTVHSVMIKQLAWYYNVDSLTVYVRTESTGHCANQSLSVDVGDACEAFAYNQHCSERVRHSMIPSSEVNVHTTYEASSPQLMSLHLSWPSESGQSVMVALTREGQSDTNCTRPDRDPPCFIASNTNSVSISPLNTSTAYSVILHGFDPSPCQFSSLGHLLNGCGERCCANYISPLPLPVGVVPSTPMPTPTVSAHLLTLSPATLLTSSPDSPGSPLTASLELQGTLLTPSPASSSTLTQSLVSPGVLTASPDSPNTFLTASLDSHGTLLTASPGLSGTHLTASPDSPSTPLTSSPDSHGTLLTASPGLSSTPLTSLKKSAGTQSLDSNTSNTVSRFPLATEGSTGLLTTAVVVPVVVLVITLSVIAVLVLLLKKWKRSPPSEAEVTPPSSVIATTDHMITTTSNCYSNSALPEVESMCNHSPKPYTPHSTMQPFSNASSPSVLVLYSPHTAEEEKEYIVGLLVGGLCTRCIDAKSPDTCSTRYKFNISSWLETEIKTSTVLLVCNSALKTDWESERPSQLVCSLKQLLHGSLMEQGLSKFATVLLGEDSGIDYVPSTYLKAQSQFTVNDIDDIVQISHFVHQVPLYSTSS